MSDKIVISEDDIGKVSDGYHTFNELYEHRVALFITLMASNSEYAWAAYHHEDGTMFDGYFIVGLDVPDVGQMTYHVADSYESYVSCIVDITDTPPVEFDGHTAADVVCRLLRWVEISPNRGDG